jgi:DNA replication and repair protein RecF
LTLALHLSKLQIRSFRNIQQLDLELGTHVNVLSGDNGQGKTSVLEAAYLVATSKSFRTERLRELIREGDDAAKVTASIAEAGMSRTQRAVLHPTRRSFFLDETRATRLGEYAVRTPVVVFHPGDLELISGGSVGRRKLLDRLALYLEPSSGDTRSRYQRAQRERQLILERRGPNSVECDVFESLMAEEGAKLHSAHSSAFAALQKALQSVYPAMAAQDVKLECVFKPGGIGDAEVFRTELRARRTADLKRKGATFGPHRDDVELFLIGRSARRHASQGQQRVLSLSLKLAELTCVREARGVHPLLLLDDVSSELDPARTGAVYEVVRDWPSQVIVTTTRPELFETLLTSSSERRDFRLSKGALTAL